MADSHGPEPGRAFPVPDEAPAGDPGAANASALLPLVYEQLREFARRCMAGEREEHTLQATALVHEAYLRLVTRDSAQHGCNQFGGRSHFFHVAAETIRHILVDHARARSALKRGGGNADGGAGWRRVAYSAVEMASCEGSDPSTILALDDAVARLEEQDADLAEVVRLRFYAGLSVEETADALGVSPRTVKRDWSLARAWLFRRLAEWTA